MGPTSTFHCSISQTWWRVEGFLRWLSWKKTKLHSHLQFTSMMDANRFSKVTFLATWFWLPCKSCILTFREVASWDIYSEMTDSDFGEHLKGFSIQNIWERGYFVNPIKGMSMGSSGESTPQMDRLILTNKNYLLSGQYYC